MKRKFLTTGIAATIFAASPAHASFLSGETLDAAADVLAWIVLVIAPVVAVGVFLIVHILPEKIAEKNHHPQLNSIKTLCILSLFFGGMLWPFAWLWAYTKPVFHKMAYGTDVVHIETETPKIIESKQEVLESKGQVAELEKRILELQQQLAQSNNATNKFSRWLHRFQHGEEA